MAHRFCTREGGVAVFLAAGIAPVHRGLWEQPHAGWIRIEASQVVTPLTRPLENPHCLARPQLLKQQHQMGTKGSNT